MLAKAGIQGNKLRHLDPRLRGGDEEDDGDGFVICLVPTTSRARRNTDQCGLASFETRSCGALLRMRCLISKARLTLRRPKGPSRRVLLLELHFFAACYANVLSQKTIPCFPEGYTGPAALRCIVVSAP